MQKPDHKPLQSPNSSIIFKLLTADISCLSPITHINPTQVLCVDIAPEMAHQMRTPQPNTPKESSEPVATSTMEMGSSQSPGGVAHPARPDEGAPALGQERRVTLSVSSPFIAISNPRPSFSYGGGTWPCVSVSALQGRIRSYAPLVTRAENVCRPLQRSNLELKPNNDYRSFLGTNPIIDRKINASLTKVSQEAQSYLDHVKAQFVDQPDIYNTFIYLLKGYKSQV